MCRNDKDRLGAAKNQQPTGTTHPDLIPSSQVEPSNGGNNADSDNDNNGNNNIILPFVNIIASPRP